MKRTFSILFILITFCCFGNKITIRRMGDPVLAKKTPVITNVNDPRVQQVANKLLEELIIRKRYLGLSAPQIGESYRIFVYRIPKDKADASIPDGIPPTIVINPEYKADGNQKIEAWEECGSAIGIVGKVPRYKSVIFTYEDIHGKKHTLKAKGLYAKVIQHECDHLNGLLYYQRMNNFDNKHYGFKVEINKYVRKKPVTQDMEE